MALKAVWQVNKKPVYLEVRPNQNIRAFLCLNLAMIPILNQFFNRNFTSWSFWDEHRSDAESVKILYNYPLNFQNMQSVSMPVQVFWNLELIPIKGNWFSSKHFLPCSPLSCVSVAQISTLRAVMFQQLPSIQERFPTHRWVFLTSPWKTHLLPNSEIRWNTWMIHGSDSFKPSGLSQV